MYVLGNGILSQPKTLVMGIVTLVLLVALACGGAATPPAEQPDAAPQATTPAAQSDTAPQATASPVPQAQPTATPAPSATTITRPLILASNLEPIHLDWMDGDAGAGTEHYRNSFTEPLTQRITASSELRGLSAESWEAVDGNPTHWRFKIRPGITFHNGEEFTAQAAATDINFIKLPERGMIYTEAEAAPMSQ